VHVPGKERAVMKIYLANPRGFCAGVDRAIDIVDLSLKKYGAPIYVRHEIVLTSSIRCATRAPSSSKN
jgi:4-hydroxy-3-methylbut-2-enyl diphosphate reductase IspH